MGTSTRQCPVREKLRLVKGVDRAGGEYTPEQQAETRMGIRLCRVRTLQRLGIGPVASAACTREDPPP